MPRSFAKGIMAMKFNEKTTVSDHSNHEATMATGMIAKKILKYDDRSVNLKEEANVGCSDEGSPLPSSGSRSLILRYIYSTQVQLNSPRQYNIYERTSGKQIRV
jgi:hypothetical protein